MVLEECLQLPAALGRNNRRAETQRVHVPHLVRTYCKVAKVCQESHGYERIVRYIVKDKLRTGTNRRSKGLRLSSDETNATVCMRVAGEQTLSLVERHFHKYKSEKSGP